MENTCNSHFIGEDWEESMQYEDMCRDMWTEWTQLIINQQYIMITIKVIYECIYY